MSGYNNYAQALSVDISKSISLLKWPLLAAAWIGGVLALAPSVYMLEVYGRVVNARSASTLLMLSLAVVFAFVLLEALEWARNRMLQRSVHAVDCVWAGQLFELSLSNQRGQESAYASQVLLDWKVICRFVVSPAFQGLLEAPVALIFLVAVFLISPVLGVFVLMGAVLQLLLALGSERTTYAMLNSANTEARAAAQRADDIVRNANVLTSMGMAYRMEQAWLEVQNRALRIQAQASEKAATSSTLSRAIQNVVSSGVLGLGCWLLLDNSLHGGPAMMIVASILGGRALAPLLVLVSQWSAVIQARQAWRRMNEHLAEQAYPKAALALSRPKGLLTVESASAGLWVRGRMHPVLHGIDLRLPVGSVLAVVGPSASGKSTLGRLLVGQIPAQQGAARLDGFNVFEWDKTELGQYLGYLPQEVQLLPGTVAENIGRFGHYPRAKVVEVASMVGLHNTIEVLPAGYDTQIDDATPLLSGGQRQRLALAMALFNAPSLVVLDEPNSSLDHEGDNVLLQAVRQMSAQATTFVIMTHRTAVLEAATHLLVLVNGRVQAFGPRDEVVAALAKAPAARS